MTPQEAGTEIVVPMADFLGGMLDDYERLDELLTSMHSRVREAKNHLRSRMYALRLAEDAAFTAEVSQLADNADDAPPTFSLEEVLSRQSPH